MILLILKILAGISLVPFLLIAFASLCMRFQLEPTRRARGIPSWETMALIKEDGSIEPASELVRHFKINTTGLVSAILMIIFGFGVPYLPGAAFKDVNLHYYLTLGMGLAAGWLALLGCIQYGNLVAWNLLGYKPPGS